MENWVIVCDTLSEKKVPRLIHGAKAQEALAIEFGTHFVRLMNEERNEAEVQVIRASLVDGCIRPTNNRYKIACYRRESDKPAKRYGGRNTSDRDWNYRGITTKSIYALIMGRIKWLEENRPDTKEQAALETAVLFIHDYLESI